MNGKSKRGRTSITKQDNLDTSPAPEAFEARTGNHRLDRKDMNRLYTGNEKHASRGNDPRPDVSTRKR